MPTRPPPRDALPAFDPAFFRHEYGRLVATLSRRVGTLHLEEVEDAVQFALFSAVQSWSTVRAPENPSAWLFRVAKNRLITEWRAQRRHEALEASYVQNAPNKELEVSDVHYAREVSDDLLRMLFLCCDTALPIASQLAFALKTLSGFDVAEIAERLMTTEANVYKRLARARTLLRERPLTQDLTDEDLASRVPAVQATLYTLFTEGYLSSHAEGAIRRDLCDEAIRLTYLMAEHPVSATPETFALLALMHLHRARMSARQDGCGGLLLLEEQDRAAWDVEEIHRGLSWLARSAAGRLFSRYHAEAGIAAEHARAPSLAETRWDRIDACYALLEQMGPSPVHRLNRAVALAEWRGPAAGIALLNGMVPPTWLAGSYMWSAVLADLHLRAGNEADAERFRVVALATAPTKEVRHLLERRLGRSSGVESSRRHDP